MHDHDGVIVEEFMHEAAVCEQVFEPRVGGIAAFEGADDWGFVGAAVWVVADLQAGLFGELHQGLRDFGAGDVEGVFVQGRGGGGDEDQEEG